MVGFQTFSVPTQHQCPFLSATVSVPQSPFNYFSFPILHGDKLSYSVTFDNPLFPYYASLCLVPEIDQSVWFCSVSITLEIILTLGCHLLFPFATRSSVLFTCLNFPRTIFFWSANNLLISLWHKTVPLIFSLQRLGQSESQKVIKPALYLLTLDKRLGQSACSMSFAHKDHSNCVFERNMNEDIFRT